MTLVWVLIIAGAISLLVCVVRAVRQERRYPLVEQELLRILKDAKELPGRQLREELRAKGHHLSSVYFYWMMAQLEDKKFVASWYESREMDGKPLQVRWHMIREEGIAYLRLTE